MPTRVPMIFGSGAGQTSFGGAASAPTSGGGGRQYDYQSILDTYQGLLNQANQANEQRYQDILGEHAMNVDKVGGTYSEMTSLLENLGQQQAERIDISETRDLATSEQDLITRGLGNTTIRGAERRGIKEDASRERRGLSEDVGRQKAAVLGQQAGAEERMGGYLTSFMERRTDQAPDMSQLAALLSQAGAGQGQLDAASSVINTGLSANARAGRDAFGQEMGGGGLQRANRPGMNRSLTSGSPSDPRFGLRGGGGGGGGGTAYVIGAGADRAASSYGGGGGGTGARVVGGGASPADAGVRGSAFDQMFQGQDVMSAGDVIGQYGGGGQVNLAEDLNLVGGRGDIDPNRIPEAQGGKAQTTPIPFHRMQEIKMGSGPPMTPDEKRQLGYAA